MEVRQGNADGIFALAILDYANLELDILTEIEEDLQDHEAISLLFLLFDCCEVSLELATTILDTGFHEFLHVWAVNFGPLWKGYLLEALLIIQNHKAIERANINLEHAMCNFLPHIMKYTLFIHPMKKMLYTYCKTSENMKDINKYVNVVINYLGVSPELRTDALKCFEKYGKCYMELYLMKLNMSGAIRFGSWTPLKNSMQNDATCYIVLANFPVEECIVTFFDVEMHINSQNVLQNQSFTVNLIPNNYKNYRASCITMYQKKTRESIVSIPINITKIEKFNKTDECNLLKFTSLLKEDDRVWLIFLLSESFESIVDISNDFHQLLFKWAKNMDSHWLGTLLEALGVIGYETIVRNLGVNWEDFKTYFLVENMEYSHFIHPMKKIIYRIFKQFNKATFESFFEYNKKIFKNVSNSYDYDHIELFSIYLITSGTIQIGSWIPFQVDREEYLECDIGPIADFLEANNYSELHLKIKRVQRRINSRIELQKKFLTNVKIPVKIPHLSDDHFYDIETDLQFHDTDIIKYSDLSQSQVVQYHIKKLEMLENIERTLQIDDRISLFFLLYDSHQLATDLMVYGNNCMNFLYKWVESYEGYWYEVLREALLIINNEKAIEEFDKNISYVKQCYLSHNITDSVFIHPIRKTLYLMNKSVIEKVVKKFLTSTLSENVEKPHYEHYILYQLLKLVWFKKIVIGPWIPTLKMPGDYTINLCEFKETLEDILYSSDFKYDDRLIWLQNFVEAENQIEKHNSRTKSKFIIKERTSKKAYVIRNPHNVGYFLIINNKHFEGLTVRKGTECDVEALTACWRSFGFNVIIFSDKKHNEIIDIVREHVIKVDQHHGAFAVCILSHGDNGRIYGIDNKTIKVNSLKKILCQNLVGKPKILIVQACRGNSHMSALTIDNNVDHDLGPEVDCSYMRLANVPEMSDLLIFWSTVKDFVSFRDIKEGSWFIQELCTCMLKYGHKMHLLDVFTHVTEQLSKKSTASGDLNSKQISQSECTFRKKLWLQKVNSA